MARTATVISPHNSTFPDPIVVCKGDFLIFDGHQDKWQGHIWLWAQSGDKKQGWVPDDLIDTANNDTKARYDYSALELSCMKGEKLNIVSSTHGWAWCENQAGKQGWVPLKNLKL